MLRGPYTHNYWECSTPRAWGVTFRVSGCGERFRGSRSYMQGVGFKLGVPGLTVYVECLT